MARETVDRLAEEISTLGPDEQRHLRELLDGWLTCRDLPVEEKERELRRRLLANGVLTRIPPPGTDLAPYRERKPIEIEGEPLSQTIIRERR